MDYFTYIMLRYTFIFPDTRGLKMRNEIEKQKNNGMLSIDYCMIYNMHLVTLEL